MSDFVDRRSIVREIWGDADTVLLVFAGAAAEFALNRAVDWLFFTGEVPRDPVGRLFVTTRFAQRIVFVDEETARRTIASINQIHHAVERERGGSIPAWAYRDVLYLLVDYSERAYELMHRPLTADDREDLYGYYRRVGEAMQIAQLPESYAGWQVDRQRHLHSDLIYSEYTERLFRAYRRQLGPLHYALLLVVQAMLVPERVRRLLGLKIAPGVGQLIGVYSLVKRLWGGRLVRELLVPTRYHDELRELDRQAA